MTIEHQIEQLERDIRIIANNHAKNINELRSRIEDLENQTKVAPLVFDKNGNGIITHEDGSHTVYPNMDVSKSYVAPTSPDWENLLSVDEVDRCITGRALMNKVIALNKRIYKHLKPLLDREEAYINTLDDDHNNLMKERQRVAELEAKYNELHDAYISLQASSKIEFAKGYNEGRKERKLDIGIKNPNHLEPPFEITCNTK